MIKDDNIVAIASPPGLGAISLIRISGNDCINQIDNIFYGFDKIKLTDQESHKLQLGYIKDGDEIIDKVLVTIFRNPKSYTGEDLIEISCHGSIYIQEKILQTILNQNCRIANPGEFTFRSFINGKMDLSEAEAVADLIASNTKASHKLALNQMRGGFKNDINKLRDELVNFASLIELELDFSQEDVDFVNIDKLNDLVSKIEIKLTALIKSFKIGNVIKNGLPIVIIGKPNSGKSTLLNCLLNEEKAIVSSVPGTTRDFIEDQININGIKCRFIDTAGIRKTEDKIENLGIKKTYEKIEEAEIILYLIDGYILNNKNFSFYKCDINNIKLFNNILSKSNFDAVIHLAAIVGDPACKLYSDLAIKTNWDASKWLIDKCKEIGIPKFIFASTCSNYGKMDSPNAFVDENSKLAPISLYAELKVKFEKYFIAPIFCWTTISLCYQALV